jgi:hypothetical protein
MRTEQENRRKKISLYLFGQPPATTAFDQGIPLSLSKDQLELSDHEFESVVSVLPEEPLCKEIEKWQQVVASNMENMQFPRPHYRPEQQAERCVRNLKLAIFSFLKTTVESVVKPQKQITIRVKGSAMEQSAGHLPPEAEIRPASALRSAGSMDIFGLSDENTTWRKFLDATVENPFGDSWRDAITIVVLSSFPDRVNVDNSQVIMASDGKTPYRVILTTATKFYDDYREYSLYFVEVLQREDYGDQETTYLLKGLEMVCRFRSAFLERSSEFLGENVGLVQPEQLPRLASRLLKELNLLHRDAQEAGLDRPGMFAKYVVMAAKGQPMLLQSLGDEMAETLIAMEKVVRPENALLLREMAAELNKSVEQQDKR